MCIWPRPTKQNNLPLNRMARDRCHFLNCRLSFRWSQTNFIFLCSCWPVLERYRLMSGHSLDTLGPLSISVAIYSSGDRVEFFSWSRAQGGSRSMVRFCYTQSYFILIVAHQLFCRKNVLVRSTVYRQWFRTKHFWSGHVTT